MAGVKTRLGRQFSGILIGRLAGAVIQAFSMAMLARWVGPAQFGLFASAYGVAIIVQTVADLGITTYLVRVRALAPTDGSIGLLLGLAGRINFWISVAGVGALSIAAFYDHRFIPLIPMAIWAGADKQVETWLAIPLADGMTWQNATSLVFRRLMALVFLLAAKAAGLDPFVGFTFGLAMSSLLSAYGVMRKNRRQVSVNSSRSIRELLCLARPFWVNSVGTQARNLDTLFVGLLLNPTAAGFYGAASRLTTPLRMIPTSFAAVLMPAASRTANGDRRNLVRSTALMAAATTVMYLGLSALLPTVIPMVLGAEFDGAVSVIQIVCVGLVFAAIASQLSALMQGWGHVNAVAAISTFSTVVCLGGIVVLGPIYGAVGAGFALALSYVLQVVAMLACLWVFRRVRNA